MRFLKYQHPLCDEVPAEGEGSTGASKTSIVIGNTKIETAEPVVTDIKPEVKSEEVPTSVVETEEQKLQRLELEKSKPTNSTSGQALQIVDADGNTQDLIYDNNGNAVNTDNVIVYTAAQLAEFENDSDNSKANELDDNIHQLITEVSGVQLLDDNNQPILFKEGLEGLAEREVLVKDTYYNKGKQEAVNELFTQYPDILEMYNFKMKHGSLDNFAKQNNYSTMQLEDNTSDDVLKSILKDYYITIGNDELTANKLVTLSENDETLRVDALDKLNKLKDIQKQKDTEIANANAIAERQAIEQLEQSYGVSYNAKGELIDKQIKGSIYDKLVVEGKIGNIMIPKDGMIIQQNGKPQRITRNQIFNYFYDGIKQPDGNYYSQAQIDEQNRINNSDNFLIQGIKNLSGGDISSLEKAMTNIIHLKDAKKIIRTVTKGSQPSSGKTIDQQLADGTAKIILRK